VSWLDGGDAEDDPYEHLEQAAQRGRPNPRGSRPRTKTRPEHADAVRGHVVAVDRGRYSVVLAEGGEQEREVIASRASELRGDAIVTGDRVRVVGDTSGEPGSLARIVGIEPRATLLRRSADDTDRVERVIVANAQQLLIVVAAADPEPRVGFVDRCLVAAYDAGIAPLLCVTKTDLADPAEFLSAFAGLELPVVRSHRGSPPLEELHALLGGRETALIGHSGVGKSTLVNALVPGAERATGSVNAVTGRGRHTSSSSVCLRLPAGAGGGWVVDTPGVRSFGLGHVDPGNILGAFADLDAVAQDCPRGCTHRWDAPDCALDDALQKGRLGEQGALRLASFRRLLDSLAG